MNTYVSYHPAAADLPAGRINPGGERGPFPVLDLDSHGRVTLTFGSHPDPAAWLDALAVVATDLAAQVRDARVSPVGGAR